jgi:hypothetical protein
MEVTGKVVKCSERQYSERLLRPNQASSDSRYRPIASSGNDLPVLPDRLLDSIAQRIARHVLDPQIASEHGMKLFDRLR